MRYIFTIGLNLFIQATLLAQNNQIHWTRSRALHDGSATNNIKLSGKGLYFNLVESAPMISDHQEFTGRASNVGSFTITLGNPIDHHATAVASVGAATGVKPQAKGIAYEAMVRNYSDAYWPSVFQVISHPAKNIRERLVVNQSFSTSLEEGNPTRAITFGSYDRQSNTVDDIAWRNPYLLIVTGAGNDGRTSNPKPNTLPIEWAYDKLAGEAQTAKNTLAVGSIYDMFLDNQNQLVWASVGATSSSGPTDDMRIKPEVCAPGNQLTIAIKGEPFSEYEYQTYLSPAAGTSLSSPIVAGTALLLQELYFTKNKQFMQAATVKGLLMHTADKIYPLSAGTGLPEIIHVGGVSRVEGPDAVCGYGAINATAAAQAILTRGKGNSSIIDEKKLIQTRRDVVDISTKAGQPVTVSISWIDPSRYGANAPFTVFENSLEPMLVNDLGVVVEERLINTSMITRTFYPYSLARQGQTITTVNNQRNKVDPYEKIVFTPLADRTYSIIVTPEEGRLWGGDQPYTLIVTGLGLDNDHLNPTCVANRVIRDPIQVGLNEEAINEITLATNVMPEAGLAEFNATTITLTDGAAIQNSDAILYVYSCSKSGFRQAADPQPDPSTLQSLLSSDVTSETPFQIYPNPLSEQCTVKSKEAISAISIYSLDGKVMFHQRGYSTYEAIINTSSLAPGIYVFMIEDAGGQTRSRKMTKL